MRQTITRAYAVLVADIAKQFGTGKQTAKPTESRCCLVGWRRENESEQSVNMS